MKRVEIIGAAILDVLVSPVEERVFQTGSYAADQIKLSYGGDALNEAVVLQGLGVPTHLVTVIGRDAGGDLIRRRMEQAGLEQSGVQERHGLDTGVNVVLVKPDGERFFLTNPHGSLRQLRLEDIPMPFPEDVGILCYASIFVSPQMKTPELEAVFRQANSQGITVCADMTRCKNGETAEEMAPALRYVDYLFANRSEAMLLTGAADVEDAAETLRRAGVGTVVIKCGGDGCYVSNAEMAFRLPAEAGVQCVDTTGAGDSFAGGFLSALAHGKSLRDCAAFANHCGARAVEKLGATTWILP